MWYKSHELERLVQDCMREKLREAERQRLIRVAQRARGSRGVRALASRVLGILRGLVTVHRRRHGSGHADPPGSQALGALGKRPSHLGNGNCSRKAIL
jgi:hypothetical protein